jgi:lysophospholipase L1-like esterase
VSVVTGGIDNSDISGMSGGWSADFNLDTAGTVTVSLRYRLLFSGAHEGNECAQALASVDGAAIGPGGSDILDELCGSDPQSNVDQDTGWQQSSIDVNLSSGVHTLTVGVYHNQKTASAEDAEVLFDNIEIVGPCTAPSVRMNQPESNHIQTSPDIFVSAFACFDDVTHAGWGVRFKLDGGISSGGDEFDDLVAPFEGSFNGVSSAEHTISVIVLDDTDTEVVGPDTQDEVTQIAVGDKYVAFGDSITYSVGDDINADDTSLDGRTTGGGYPPILDDLLTNDTGRPHRIVNEGVPGDNTTDGLDRIADSLAVNPDAQAYLLLLGTNDSGGSMPRESGCGKSPGDSGYSGSFKDNMQQLIDAIVAGGKAPVLGQVPITLGACSSCTPFPDPATAARNILIQDYNTVITGGECSDLTLEPNGLIVDNGISVTPPDFYQYFEANQAEYDDNLHPNGTGYQSMADLWFNALMP